MPYRSKAQQRWAHATKQPWAREWDQATKKLKRGKKRGFAALPDRARTKVGKSLYGAIAKKAEPVNRDRQGAAIAGAGASAAGLGAIGGGVPGLNMDYSKHPALKAPMGIFGWRQKAHEGAVRDFEADLARKPSRDGRQRRAEYRKGRPRTRESRAYLRAYTKAKIPEEQKIIRHMRTGRMATNALLVGGLAATGYGIHRAKVQKSDRARDRTFGAVLGAGAGGAAIAEGVSQVLVHQGRKWEDKGAEARRAAQRVAPKVTPAHSAYAAWDDPKLLRGVSATDAAEAGRQRGIASQARYFGGVYRNTARHLRTGRNVGLAAAAVGATGLALRPKGKHKSKVAKTYVGNGAYRSISTLSPRARKVLRQNLLKSKLLRSVGVSFERGKNQSFASDDAWAAAGTQRAFNDAKHLTAQAMANPHSAYTFPNQRGKGRTVVYRRPVPNHGAVTRGSQATTRTLAPDQRGQRHADWLITTKHERPSLGTLKHERAHTQSRKPASRRYRFVRHPEKRTGEEARATVLSRSGYEGSFQPERDVQNPGSAEFRAAYEMIDRNIRASRGRKYVVDSSGQATKVGKSYVGAGAYRSISSLSPRARKVLRRNLVLHRKARRGAAAEPDNPAPRTFLESSVTPMPKSNVQRRIDSWREIRSGDTGSLPPQLQAVHATGRKILTQRRKATKTPNLFTTKDATHSQRANLERAARGMKFKTPTVVHLNAKEGSLPDGVPGANIPVRGDTNVVAMGSRGMTARVAGGNRTSMVRHELAHAQGKPGRHVRLQLRKRPMDSLAREEGRAEGIGSQASPSQHSASEYASAFKGKRLSEYRRIRDKVAGRRMKEHRSDAFTLNAINRGRPGGKNKNDTIAALGGTDAWKSNLRELVAANPAPDPYSTAAMEQRARNLREMRRLRRQRPDFYRNR